MKRKIIPGEVPSRELHQYLISAVAPRPIAFVSSLDENGVQNLAPYSFFNVFSSNPPIAVFSSNRKGTNNATKDTLHNVKLQGECVINVVPHSMLRQMSLASVEFPSDVSEFAKVGLTPEPSEIVQAPRVGESPVNMECKVLDIITLGDKGGAGHLIICEILMMTIDESVIVENAIDQDKLDLMGRLGKNFYVRASGNALMELHQSVYDIPIGFDGLPKEVRESAILTGNEIAILASLMNLPGKDTIISFSENNKNLISLSDEEKHLIAKNMISQDLAKDALCLMMI
ncbi:MAG: flavin reductase family protein [Saprospiraceae bacterium]|jgi:flavin reductase (DIM6/NTAB) family NADH-FMN oxidoreductase RutF|nr:flavin reductase family protein [Saprospiraceae bacterium]MBL0023535.1 flavin reductase family protein [Saprospiraceae bacterium]